MPKVVFNKRKACAEKCHDACSGGHGPITKDVTLCPKVKFVLEHLSTEEAKQKYIEDVKAMFASMQH